MRTDWETEVRGHDADNGMPYVVERDLFAHDRRIHAEPAAPERFAEYNDSLTPRLFIVGQQRAAKDRRDAEGRKEVAGHTPCENHGEISSLGQICLVGRECGEMLKR